LFISSSMCEESMPAADVRLERWSLDDLFPGFESDEYRQARLAIDRSLQDFETQRARLTDDLTPQGLFDILQDIFNVLYTDGESDEIGGDAPFSLLIFRQV